MDARSAPYRQVWTQFPKVNERIEMLLWSSVKRRPAAGAPKDFCFLGVHTGWSSRPAPVVFETYIGQVLRPSWRSGATRRTQYPSLTPRTPFPERRLPIACFALSLS